MPWYVIDMKQQFGSSSLFRWGISESRKPISIMQAKPAPSRRTAQAMADEMNAIEARGLSEWMSEPDVP